MKMTKISMTTTDRTENTPLPNPDDLLKIEDLIWKYRAQFIRYFLPKYAEGLRKVGYNDWHYYNDPDPENLRVVYSVKVHHQHRHGKHCKVHIPMDKIKVWRTNINLYDFIA